MAISRRVALGLASIGLALSGCGGKASVAASTGRSTSASHPATSATRAPTPTATATSTALQSRPAARPAAPFAWLRPGPPPAGWPVARIPLGADMPYPPGWERIGGDAGTASAALFNRRHDYVGYLNLTPRQSNETLADWTRFRREHNADENERDVRTLAVGTGLRFSGGHGTCVLDAYTTVTHTRYIEFACLDVGRKSSVVIVGASPTRYWARVSPVLERAISSLTA